MSLQCRWGHTHFLLLITSYLVTYTKNKKIEHQISFFIQVHATFYTDFSSTKKLYLITISLFDFWKSNSFHLTKLQAQRQLEIWIGPFLLILFSYWPNCVFVIGLRYFGDYELWLSILISFTDSILLYIHAF